MAVIRRQNDGTVCTDIGVCWSADECCSKKCYNDEWYKEVAGAPGICVFWTPGPTEYPKDAEDSEVSEENDKSESESGSTTAPEPSTSDTISNEKPER